VNDDIAAIAAALAALVAQESESESESERTQASRWKAAARRPELEIEEIRALH
jgi:hypothetical protein